jgi:predicted nucleotide-binding protein
MEKTRRKEIAPLILLPTVSAKEIVELLQVQKTKGEELLKNSFLSPGDLQYWNLFTKEIFTRAFGPRLEAIDSILYTGENKPLSAYEPESNLEKMRRTNFQTTLKNLEKCIEQLLAKGSSGVVTFQEESPPPSEEKPEVPREVPKNRGKKDLAKELNVDLPVHRDSPPVAAGKKVAPMTKSKDRKVLILHGPDEEKMALIADFLKKLDLEPLFPEDAAGQGMSLLEKYKQYEDVVFAIAFLTGDDMGYPQGEEEESRPRPAQNVIFELGFLMGRLEPNLVCALYEEGLDLPSEFKGSILIPYDEGGMWRLLVARALKMARVDVDLNKAI